MSLSGKIMRSLKKLKYLFKPRFLFNYYLEKFFINWENPRYFEWLYNFSKKYGAFYQGDGNADRVTNGGWRWLEEFIKTKKPKIIFDVGGYDALYSLKILEIDPLVELHVFEPNPHSFKEKLMPALSNFGSNVHLINKGMSDVSGVATLYTHPDRGAVDSLHRVKGGKYNHVDKVEVELSTIDSYMSENGISKLDFLKIDTEGNDLNVIKGAEKMLKEGRIDTIQFEFSLHYTYSHTYFRDFTDYLSPFGYKVFKIMPKNIVFVENPEMERTTYSYFVAIKNC